MYLIIALGIIAIISFLINFKKQNNQIKYFNDSWLLEKTKEDIILVILNTEIEDNIHFKNLIKNANYIVCADGGANRLYDYLKKKGKENNIIPDVIIGDFDSIKKNVIDFYNKKDIIIITDSDQDTTDLQKSLKFISDLDNIFNEFSHIVIYGAFGDRFDHELSSIHTLYKAQTFFKNKLSPFNKVTLVGNKMIAFLLVKGLNVINSNNIYKGKTCGLLLIGAESTVTTNGLKWNLNNKELSFSKLISTSNEIIETEVHIAASKPLIWTCILSS